MKHPFLMHGLLASAAMHLAWLRPDEAQGYLRLCDQHQCTAISSFREQLHRVDKRNAGALFALAVLLGGAAFARMLPRVTTQSTDASEEILECIVEVITLTRGARDVLDLGAQWVYESPMRNAVAGFEAPAHALAPAHVRERMHQLEELCISECEDGSQRNACLEALRHLRSTYDTVCTLHKDQLEIGHVMRWLVMPSPLYLDMLREHNDMAVLILCHFWILWTAFRHLWFVQDLASLTLPFLRSILADRYRSWLDWVNIELESGMPCLNSTAVLSSVPSTMSTPDTSNHSPHTPF